MASCIKKKYNKYINYLIYRYSLNNMMFSQNMCFLKSIKNIYGKLFSTKTYIIRNKKKTKSIK